VLKPILDRLTVAAARSNTLVLDDRNHQILMALDAVRLITRRHLVLLLRVHPSNVSRRIKRLYQFRYIERLPQPVRAGPGAPTHIYCLGALGAEYVAEARSCPLPEQGRHTGKPSSAFRVAHDLDVADLYVAFQVAAQDAGMVIEWRNRGEVAYRYPLAAGGEGELEPDGVFLVRQGTTTRVVFLEVDPAGESPQPWQRQVEAYRQYFSEAAGFAGQWESLPGLQAVVLVTTPTPARLDILRRVTAWDGVGQGVPVPLGLAVHSEVQPDTALSPVWQGLGGDPIHLLGPV